MNAYKVLFLSDYFSTWDMGGASRVLLEQMRGLAGLKDAKVEFELVSGYPGLAADENLQFPWHRLRYKSVGYLPGLAALLRRRFLAFRPDLVHIHQPLVGALALGVLPCGFPRLYHFHSFWGAEKALHAEAQPGLESWACRVKARLEHAVLARMPRAVALSEYSRELLRARFPKMDVRVIPGSIHSVEWHLPASGAEKESPAFRFIAVRRLEPRMGLDALLQAVADVQGAMPPTLTLVGTGRMEPALRAQADEPALRGRVHFAGRVEHHELLRLLAAHDCMVVPSRALEGFGMAVIESFAAGLPVLATGVGGLREFARHAEVFHMMEDASPENIAAGLRWAALNFSPRAHLAERARKIAGEFYDTAKTTRQLHDLYQEILAERNS